MAEQNSTMANFGGRYTCLNCDVDGAVDVRRVAPGLRVNGFPLATSAYGQAIGVPRPVRKPRSLGSKPGFEGKGSFESDHVIIAVIKLTPRQIEKLFGNN